MSDARRVTEALALFDEIIELPPEQREARLRELAARDVELAAEVRALLAADEGAEDFLAPPAPAEVERLARAGTDGARRPEAPDAEELEIDSRLGAYRIVRRIASGGMGAVYLASRADRQFEGLVAIKVQRRALATERAAARARLERQTLASLTHPYIARLLDGGETADGRPYLVLEYIEGEPVDRWCAERALGIDARLDLLQRIGVAVAHAHRKLVVHRDIKPSNILVTADGTPRLLDFGIARLLGGTGSDEVGRRTQVAFTPGYASPEQQRGERVGTTADIYSLGRLLRALLPEALPRLARIELEAIADRASAEREEDRYASVEQLLQELDRFRADLPVLAHPSTWRYRATKFARRNGLTLAVAAGGAAGLLAAGFALFAAWHAASEERVQATVARKRAEAASIEAAASERLASARADEAERSAARYGSTLEMLRRLFLAPTSRGAGPEVSVAEFLDDARTEIALMPDLGGEASVPLHRFLGHAYVGLGRVEDGIAEYERAHEKLCALYGSDHRDALAAEIELGDALVVGDHVDRGRKKLERAHSVLRARKERFAGQDLMEVHLLRSLARMHQELREIEPGLERAREAMSLCERPGIPGTLRAEVYSVASALELMRDALSERAREWIEESIRAAASELGADHPAAQEFQLNLAHHRWARGEPRAALEIAERVLSLRRASYPGEHTALIAPLVAVGRMKSEFREHAEALKLLREASLIFRRAYGPAPRRSNVPLAELAAALRRAGEIEEAERILRELLAENEKLVGRISQDYLSVLVSLGVLEEGRGRFEAAHARFVEALEITRTLRGERHLETARAWINLGATTFRLQQLEESAAAYAKGVALRRELLPPAHPSLADALYSWSRTEIARGRWESAEPLLREAADVLLRAESPVESRLARALLDLARTRRELGDGAGEREALEELAQRARSRGDAGRSDLRAALEALLVRAAADGDAARAAELREELARTPVEKG